MKLNNIKAAFFDMDGTIVSFTTHKISKRDIAAMNKLREKGILVFISSGRDKKNILKVLDNTLEVDGFVGMNGNLNVTHNEIVSEHFMEEEDVRFIVDASNRLGFALSLFTREGVVLNKVDDKVHAVHDHVEVPIPRLASFDDIDLSKIYQMNSYTTKAFDEEHLIPYMKNSVFKRWNDDFADINSVKTSKLVGINELIHKLGIDIKDTISFGDSENDLEMIKGTGASVAMANAMPIIKDAATYITLDCDESGAAHFIENYLL